MNFRFLENAQKIISKNPKKVLDKSILRWYYNGAVEDSN